MVSPSASLSSGWGVVSPERGAEPLSWRFLAELPQQVVDFIGGRDIQQRGNLFDSV